MKLENCPSCGGSVKVDYCLGEYFISCENNCMDIPACFHTSKQYTINDWNERMNTRKGE